MTRVNNSSPYALAKQLEADMLKILSTLDVYSLGQKPAQLVAVIKRGVADARLDIRDYEFAESRAEQLKLKTVSIERTVILQREILSASEYNIFSAIDVAQLSALIDRIQERLE